MRHTITVTVAAAALAGAVGTAEVAAQDEGPNFVAVGEMAPDFELAGATRHGTLANPVRLSDYRGDTVVLAFFFRVRTPG